MKTNILITGATGNVGSEVINSLLNDDKYLFFNVIVGARDTERARKQIKQHKQISFRTFDFESISTYEKALREVHLLFLLRPPHVSDTDKYFRPLITTAKECGVKGIVFLSVQGVETNDVIPHARIEKLIIESGISYAMLRPSYFMQNITTTLAADLQEGTIRLPAGKALFNWINVKDIAEVASVVLTDFSRYTNQTLELTGNENLSFEEAIQRINNTLGSTYKYKNTNIFAFFLHKRRQRVPTPMIFVMLMLHYLPRFSKPPRITNTYTLITGKKSSLIEDFARSEMQYTK